MDDENDKEKQLGQVLTSDAVARLMVNLLVENLAGEIILDPCVGKNIFFRILEEKEAELGKKFRKIGIEVDPEIVDKEWYGGGDDRELYLQNFFDFSHDLKLDGVIMNPPYVRQEILVNSNINSKEKIIRTLDVKYTRFISGRQNLYVYFFMKAHQLLKDHGRLVAVCYDSWLYTQYGELFKKFLEANFVVRNIIHFEEKAFINAEVGATILDLSKQTSNFLENSRQKFGYAKYGSPESYEHNNCLSNMEIPSLTDLMVLARKEGDPLVFPTDVFTQLMVLCKGKIRRGTSPKANEFFLFESMKFPEMVPIVKDVKKISGFLVSKHELRYIVNAGNNGLSKELQDYLKVVENKIMESNRYITLKREIESGKKWFRIRFVEPGYFIINYYLRKNVKFIYNPEKYYVSNNFYIFDTKIDPMLAFALLNSVFTRIGILRNSRTQGGGLRKIQLYEFRRVPVFNPSILNKSKSKELAELGKSLTESRGEDSHRILKRIDHVLFQIYDEFVGSNVSLEDIHEFYQMKLSRTR